MCSWQHCKQVTLVWCGSPLSQQKRWGTATLGFQERSDLSTCWGLPESGSLSQHCQDQSTNNLVCILVLLKRDFFSFFLIKPGGNEGWKIKRKREKNPNQTSLEEERSFSSTFCRLRYSWYPVEVSIQKEKTGRSLKTNSAKKASQNKNKRGLGFLTLVTGKLWILRVWYQQQVNMDVGKEAMEIDLLMHSFCPDHCWLALNINTMMWLQNFDGFNPTGEEDSSKEARNMETVEQTDPQHL